MPQRSGEIPKLLLFIISLRVQQQIQTLSLVSCFLRDHRKNESVPLQLAVVFYNIDD